MDVRLLLATTVLAGCFVTTSVNGDEEPTAEKKIAIEKMTISQIMKTAHKKPEDLLKKVARGKATKEDKQTLLKMYQVLASRKPSKGKAESWKSKTQLLVAAAESAVKGTKGYEKQLYRASNCMACHRQHK